MSEPKRRGRPPLNRNAPAKAAPEAPDTLRFDGWQSLLTGMGTDRDRVTSASFSPDFISHQVAQGLWIGDDMAARAIEVWPDEMLRRGYRLLTADDREAEEAVTSHLETVGLNDALFQALCYQRAYGGGAILLGADDGASDWALPLQADKVRSLDWVQAYDATEMQPSKYYQDPKSPKFMRPSHYTIGRMFGTRKTSDIHESRFLIFDGIRVSSNFQNTNNAGWGYSVLSRMWGVLRGFNIGWAGAWHLLSDFGQGVYKMKGLADSLLKNQDKVLARLKTIEMAKSTMRSVVVDAELEDYTRIATPISGLDTVLDKANTRLAAAADMPVMILFGQSPGGLGSTGDGEIKSFYGRVAAKQTKLLQPALLRVVGLLAAIYKLEPGFKIVFNPLDAPSEAEAATARLTQAQTDAIYIANQVATPEEIADSRFGASGYSFDTRLDWEARKLFALSEGDADALETETITEDPAEIEARNQQRNVGVEPTAPPAPTPEI